MPKTKKKRIRRKRENSRESLGRGFCDDCNASKTGKNPIKRQTSN